MAYDQHATYEPPRRGYYGQMAAQPSEQDMYQQNNNGPYSRHDAYEQPPPQQQYGYEQSAPRMDYGHEQQARGYADDRGYDQSYDRGQQSYDHGYNHNYQQDARPAQRAMPQQSYQRDERPVQGRAYQEEMGDRSYDARYQPRAPPQGQYQGSAAGPPRRPDGQQMPAPRNFAGRPPNATEMRGPPPRQNGYPPQQPPAQYAGPSNPAPPPQSQGYAAERTDSKDLQHFAAKPEVNLRSAQPSGNWPIPNSGLPNQQPVDDGRHYSGPAAQRPQTAQAAEQWPIRAEPPSQAVRDDRRSPPQPMDPGHPDALPHHPVPVRAGLAQANGAQQPQPARPAPTRNHASAPGPSGGPPRPASGGPVQERITKAELARLLADVEANPHNPKRALIYAKKLVEASVVLASDDGRADAKTTAKNRDRYVTDAYKRVKKLAAGGYPEAMFYLADCYGQGQLGLEPDTKEAFSLYQAAAKAGHPQAAYRTAVCCEMGPDEGGGTRKDFPKAVQWYRRAATLGDTAAMFKIGVVLLKGLLGEQKNVSEAINWLKRAAERADKDTPHALHELAALYDTGNTAPEIRNKVVADDAYALELLERAAALGYKFSQFRLGQAYEYGHLGLRIDNRLSITWYTRAAAQGEHQAELALSGWYLTGAAGILEHNDTEAYLWARKAAVSEPPLAKAMFAMGYFAENGIGCPASMEDAKKWYGRAAYYKFPKALERIEELKRNPNKGGRGNDAKLGRKDQKRDEAECSVM
ncbi:HCP-like protein [Dissoconium aciculare CBS 342.82]|uniref:HCP-like protein n=1 Tax=Dissoconium aciculare CBS 342.82 TaxID=1314786 RepID=A0A6J3MHN4_9PEZI|nr:HCP-like protein [Dissoconium aciculare CBS 342.82]KAF1827204.1 HCP-like protein [Dissoconium aciculare CBS 342.82]